MKKSNCLRIILSCVLPFTLQATWHECCCPNFDYSYNPTLLEPTPCGKVFVEGEWLLWRSNIECGTWAWVTTTAVDANPASPNPPSFFAAIDERELSHKWNSGFRVGLGYDFACDQWGVRATYTYYDAKADDNIAFANGRLNDSNQANFTYQTLVNAFLPSGLDFFDLDPTSGEYPSATRARACWKVTLNQIDLDFTREYFVGRYVSIRPVLGLRYYSLDQKFDTFVSQINSDFDDVSLDERELQQFNSCSSVCFHAFGIKAGFNSQWEVACGFGVFGDAYLTLGYGQFRSKLRDRFTFINGDIDPSLAGVINGLGRIEYANTWCSVKPVGDFSLGIYWRSGFNCDRNLFEAKVAWENHVFFNHNQFRGIAAYRQSAINEDSTEDSRSTTDLITTARCSDVSFNGFSFMVGVWF